MKVRFLQIGKTDQDWLREGVEIYRKRLVRYLAYESQELILSSGSRLPEEKVLQLEAEKLLGSIKSSDWLVLLDDKGLQLTSQGMATWMNKKMVSVGGDLVFACGGAYGFHSSVYSRANEKLSLSPMTFTHQMVRLIFTEQLYRAMTILRNEPYHHS